MAYIPPHKRRPKHDARPELVSPVFMKNPESRSWLSVTEAHNRVPEINYSVKLCKRWFAVGLDDHSRLPSSVRFLPVPYEDLTPKGGEISMALINTDLDGENSSVLRERVSESPWIYIAENITRDLVSSFECARGEMESRGVEAMKPTLVARFGKVIFRSSSFESITEALNDEDSLRKLKRHLRTNIPKSYMEYVVKEGALKIGLEFKGEKSEYRVQLFDSARPCSTITCKCRALGKDGKLELVKVELSSLRYMVVDVSCLEKNVDLRLMLNTRTNATNELTDNDMKNIRDLIDSAILDPRAKGGLRWPFGKDASGNKFTLSRIWHTKTKTYVNSSLKLKVRDSDRFGFGKTIGESSREVFVVLKQIVAKLKEPDVDKNLIEEMLKDDLRALCESFFCCESFLKWEK